MKIPLYQVDAFTNERFKGNPAAVCPLKEWLPDQILQNIAAENNLSETAFFLPGDDFFELRWFTPTMEVDLCGHATLAAAHILFNHLNFKGERILFTSKSGELSVSRKKSLICLNFPAWKPEKIETPRELVKGLGITPLSTFKSRDCLAQLESQNQIEDLQPDFEALLKLDFLCIIVTARGKSVDFVSRVFAPKAGILEDPVTGSAHSTLIPFWAQMLGKNTLTALQLSKRGGKIFCSNLGNRVEIAGEAVTYLIGEIKV